MNAPGLGADGTPRPRPLRAAVIGTGWGLVHVHALRQHGVEVVALAGTDLDATQRVAHEQGVPLAVADLAALKPLALDMACIATPPHTHAQVAAALAPLPLLCEKPLLGPEGTPDQCAAFSPRTWVNYAFAQLPAARAAQRVLPRLGRLLRVESATAHDLGRTWAPRDALAELASHPWSLLVHLHGPPGAVQGWATGDEAVTLAMRLGTGPGATPATVRCHAEPGLNGLRHALRWHTEAGVLELGGAFRRGRPWRFEPLRLDGKPLPALGGNGGDGGNGGGGDGPDDDPGQDPWIAANVRTIGQVVAVLRGQLGEAEARAQGLFDVPAAFALDQGLKNATLRTLSMRQATADDLELTYRITRDAMRPYVERTWGPWHEAEQTQKHAQSFEPHTTRIVELEDQPVGLVCVEDHSDHRWLVKLYLLHSARGRGLGTHLLRAVIEAAEAARQPLRLRVLRVNTGAQALYARHGFRVTDETQERLFMSREPQAWTAG